MVGSRQARLGVSAVYRTQPGSGRIELNIDRVASAINYTLTYAAFDTALCRSSLLRLRAMPRAPRQPQQEQRAAQRQYRARSSQQRDDRRHAECADRTVQRICHCSAKAGRQPDTRPMVERTLNARQADRPDWRRCAIFRGRFVFSP